MSNSKEWLGFGLLARQRKGVLEFQGWKIGEESIPHKRMEEVSSLIFIF